MSDIEPDLHDMHDPVKHEYQNKENKTPETYQLINADDGSNVNDSVKAKDIEMFWHDKKNSKSYFTSDKDDTKIDFVFQHNVSNLHGNIDRKLRIYLDNLMKAGLLLNMDEDEFIKIHVPTHVVERYCEILKIKMPIDEKYDKTKNGSDNPSQPNSEKTPKLYSSSDDVERNEEPLLPNETCNLCSKLFEEERMEIKPPKANKTDETKLQFLKATLKKMLSIRFKTYDCYWAEYNTSRTYLFSDKAKKMLNSQTMKITIGHYILQRASCDDAKDKNPVGFEHFMGKNGPITAAFPLHDNVQLNTLSKKWSKFENSSKVQPINYIKKYFGANVAFYFAWLGFYTNMLVFPSILGVGTMLYGLITLKSHNLTNDICTSNHTMCPLCKPPCSYWNIKDSCTQAKLTHLFDNNVNIGFTLIMTLWSVVYLKLWKRYAADLTYKWGISTNHNDNPDEPIRSKYKSFSTQKFIKRVYFNLSRLLTVITVIFCAFVNIIFYILSRYATRGIDNEILTNVLSAILNLALILALLEIYNRIAEWLTDLENHKRQTEYDKSLTLKKYIFQFVNLYSSTMYLAFIKGKFAGYPESYHTIFGFRQEQCDQSGCYLEAFIQLSVVLFGFKIYTNICAYFSSSNDHAHCNENLTRCKINSKLKRFSSDKISDEYMEMVIQYGFVVLFVNAFPLAPFVALLNNSFEMRLDAQKYVERYQRPVPQSTIGIGIWLHIMEIIGRFSIFSNSIMIGFTSKFIPYMTYVYKFNFEQTDTGFFNSTLFYFNVADYPDIDKPHGSGVEHITMCRYRGYRNSTISEIDGKNKYHYTSQYWEVLIYRVIFIVIFQITTGMLRVFLDWIIPDVPSQIHKRTLKETSLISKIIEKHLHVPDPGNENSKVKSI